MASLQALARTIESEQALSWLSAFFSERIGSRLSISISRDGRYFVVNDDVGVAFKVRRFDLNQALGDSRVLKIRFENERLSFITGLYCFSSEPQTCSYPWFEVTDQDSVDFHCDFISFAYFNLTRLEELIPTKNDRHNRYQHGNSLASKYGYTSVPVVDHWVLVIRSFYDLIRRDFVPPIDKYELLLTHDVDLPFRFYFRDFSSLLRFAAGRLFRREFKLFRTFFRHCIGKASDPADTFGFIMEHSERLGIVSHFNFFGGTSSPRWDGNYSLKQNKIQALIKEIITRSHKIGIHFSYHTFRDAKKMSSELAELNAAVQRVDRRKKVDSARMHYLRWSSWETASHLAQAGIAQDTTLGFAEQIGFRAGTCFPFRPFDPVSLTNIPITIVPLIAMEGTVWGENYMNIQNGERFFLELASIVDRVREVDGVFNMLWHNSDLAEDWQKDLYLRVIEYASRS